ncbi:histidine phosphotransferase ChpT [Aliiruegeria haliotis]|uniref:Histidine phosphotransferase ChpT n=1 Tax=Aliiruegeria haliotis TaxID=1280846 RepID=A0A2T0RL90_9RHOB|nr:histidine phosphotransferase family protein [Aliiruegeria haliotis]PRY21890.1 histidine phosphotransferase ChpT [Aliiruegeria haliotis]
MSSDLPRTSVDLSALIGSRICHDLISPIGAIGNGVELLSMSGANLGPELSLISESVANANARIRFYRIAFGHGGQGQGVGRSEIQSVLKDMYQGSRLKITWSVGAECRRDDVKAAFLALQCLETAMPFGGEIEISRDEEGWKVAGTSPKLKLDPEVWAALQGGSIEAITPALVHFAMLPVVLKQSGRRLQATRADDRVTLAF